jgi:hypothetical protein
MKNPLGGLVTGSGNGVFYSVFSVLFTPLQQGSPAYAELFLRRFFYGKCE